MPELPEVETVARQLDSLVGGQRVISTRIRDSKLHEPGYLVINSTSLKHRRIARVYRSGKQVAIELIKTGRRDTALWLVVHLRMTGRLIYCKGSRAVCGDLPRAEIGLSRGRLLFFDVRRFGTLRLYDSKAAFAPAGLDPLDPSFQASILAGQLAGSAQAVKAWLLRQDRLSGIGNIYACEALHASGIHPLRQAGSLSAVEVKSLYRSLRHILRAAIRHCGTTFSDFQDSSGSLGGYARFLKVYGCEGMPCGRCGGIVERMAQQQRSTFYCPGCQR